MAKKMIYGILERRQSCLAYFLRVGVDSSGVEETGGFHAPIFDDKTFEFIPVPIAKGRSNSGDKEYCERNFGYELTFGNTCDRTDVPFVDYSKLGKNRKLLSNLPIHVDPDFKHATYGDIVKRDKWIEEAHMLEYLRNGDFLVFCAALDPWGRRKQRRGLYIVGFFEVNKVHTFRGKSKREKLSMFKALDNVNPHTTNVNKFNINSENRDNLVLVEGNSKKSSLLQEPVLITCRAYSPTMISDYMVSKSAVEKFGFRPDYFTEEGKFAPDITAYPENEWNKYVKNLEAELAQRDWYTQNLHRVKANN
jgi:hypothetical protein